MKTQYKIFFCIVLPLIVLCFLFIGFDHKPKYQIANTGIIHGVYPGGFTGEEDDFSELDIISYERAAHKKAAFIYFSHNWYKSREFPKKMVDMIYARNSIPYIRLMLRSHPLNQGFNEKTYSLKNIYSGTFNDDLRKWFRAAAKYNKPLIVEYGTEINGDFFPWNGTYHGKAAGAELFKDVYRNMITMSMHSGATNILWAFHLNDRDSPDEEWNHFENYYPGDKYIDLISVSIYGMLTPKDIQPKYVGDELAILYPRIVQMTSKKILLVEWASTDKNMVQDQVAYAKNGFDAILSGQYPNLIGFSWWNEWWRNKGSIDSTMRIQDTPKLAKTFQNYLSNPRIDDTLKFNSK